MSIFKRLYLRVLDRDRDGDVDRDDLMIVAKRLLERYLSPEESKLVLDQAKQQVLTMQALRELDKQQEEEEEARYAEGGSIRLSSLQINYTNGPIGGQYREAVVQLIAALILRLTGKKVPTRVINFVIEAIVNLLGILREKEEPVPAKS